MRLERRGCYCSLCYRRLMCLLKFVGFAPRLVFGGLHFICAGGLLLAGFIPRRWLRVFFPISLFFAILYPPKFGIFLR